MRDAGSYFARNDVEASGNIDAIMGKIDEFLIANIEKEALAAEAEAAKVARDASQTMFDSGAKDQIASLTKEQLMASEDTQKALKDLGVDIEAIVADDRVSSVELKEAQKAATEAMTRMAAEDKAKFDQVLGVLKATQKSDLIEKANAAKAAGDEEGYKALMAQAESLDDFILRPRS